MSNIETILRKNFQRKISIIIDDKEIKTGKFLLFKNMIYYNNYYIEFHIRREKKIDMFKIPYPFQIEEHVSDNLIYFDYRLKTLCQNNKNLEKQLFEFVEMVNPTPVNRFYNKIVEIKFE